MIEAEQPERVVRAPVRAPSRSWLYRVANTAASVLDTLHVTSLSLDPSDLRRRAERATGHLDFGDRAFEEPLALLCDELRDQADLNPIGRLLAREQLVTILENRLQTQDHWTRHPEILQDPVERPLVIIGLPRSGTTFLQHLLDNDPANRSLLHWEAARPCPPPQTATYDADPRIRQSQRSLKLLDHVAPGWRAVHPELADGPTECVSLLNHSLVSPELAVTYHIPGYLDWFLAQDLRAPYRHLVQQLQLLQSGHRRDRWLLKSPGHLFALDALLEALPDACVVQVHREPDEVLASFASLVTFLRSVTSDRLRPAVVGERWTRMWHLALDRAMDVRAGCDGDRFIDVHHRDLLADPMGQARRIYDHFDLPLGEVARQQMASFATANPPDRHGVHRYDPRDFGLVGGDTSVLFDRYRERFAIHPRP